MKSSVHFGALKKEWLCLEISDIFETLQLAVKLGFTCCSENWGPPLIPPCPPPTLVHLEYYRQWS